MGSCQHNNSAESENHVLSYQFSEAEKVQQRTEQEFVTNKKSHQSRLTNKFNMDYEQQQLIPVLEFQSPAELRIQKADFYQSGVHEGLAQPALMADQLFMVSEPIQEEKTAQSIQPNIEVDRSSLYNRSIFNKNEPRRKLVQNMLKTNRSSPQNKIYSTELPDQPKRDDDSPCDLTNQEEISYQRNISINDRDNNEVNELPKSSDSIICVTLQIPNYVPRRKFQSERSPNNMALTQ